MSGLISKIEASSGLATQLQIQAPSSANLVPTLRAASCSPSSVCCGSERSGPESHVRASLQKGKVRALHLRQALDAMEGYNERAEKYLSKSVGHRPSVDAGTP